jgi:hypothetical protein
VSETLVGVIIGAVVTGVFLIGAQVITARIQANAARDAWNRTQVAQQRSEWENTCLAILQLAHEIESAVVRWDTENEQWTMADISISSASHKLEDSSLSIVLRQGPADPIIGLVARLTRSAKGFSDLHRVGRVPLATADEKHEQAAEVSAAASMLRSHLHMTLNSQPRA